MALLPCPLHSPRRSLTSVQPLLRWLLSFYVNYSGCRVRLINVTQSLTHKHTQKDEKYSLHESESNWKLYTVQFDQFAYCYDFDIESLCVDAGDYYYSFSRLNRKTWSKGFSFLSRLVSIVLRGCWVRESIKKSKRLRRRKGFMEKWSRTRDSYHEDCEWADVCVCAARVFDTTGETMVASRPLCSFVHLF